MDLDQPGRYSRFNIVTLGVREGSNKWLNGYNMEHPVEVDVTWGSLWLWGDAAGHWVPSVLPRTI